MARKYALLTELLREHAASGQRAGFHVESVSLDHQRVRAARGRFGGDYHDRDRRPR